MNVLVTGGTGFIGKKMVQSLLEKNYAVKVLTRNPLNNEINWARNVSVTIGSLGSSEVIADAVKGVDVVVHLAAQLGAWKTKYSNYYQTNVEGTRLLIAESKKAGVKHFLYISTAGVFGTLRYVPADEQHPCLPRYPYEKTKYAAEQIIQNEIKNGSPATIIRPSHVYGPGDINTVPLIRFMKKCKFFPLIGGGKANFQPVYIDDLADGIIQCLEHREKVLGNTYVLAGKDFITFRQYISLLSAVLGIRVLCLPIPYLIAKRGAYVYEALAGLLNKNPILTRFRVDFFGGHQHYSISRAEADISYRPRVSISDGTELAVKWYIQKKFI